MYQALLTGGIPPAHLHGLRGVYIAKEYKENASGKKYELGFGYFIDSTIVMPLYKGPGGTGHDMVGEHRGAAGLWLMHAGATELRFAAETDGAALPVVVPRATYEAVAALGAEQLQRLRPGLARGPHVSMQRLGLVDG